MDANKSVIQTGLDDRKDANKSVIQTGLDDRKLCMYVYNFYLSATQ